MRAGYDTVLGQLIIIDHGNGIETHYGYNSALFVSEGEHILKGQHIAHQAAGAVHPMRGCLCSEEGARSAIPSTPAVALVDTAFGGRIRMTQRANGADVQKGAAL